MKLNFNIELSDQDIVNISNQLQLKLNGVYMKDTLPSRLQNGNYVINLDSSDGTGTHWCVCNVNNSRDTICYFDSFGCVSPEEVMKIFKKKYTYVYYSDKIIQSTKSVVCGYYCIMFMLYFKQTEQQLKNPYDQIKSFHDMFQDNGIEMNNSKGIQNDNLLKKYLSRYI